MLILGNMFFFGKCAYFRKMCLFWENALILGNVLILGVLIMSVDSLSNLISSSDSEIRMFIVIDIDSASQ